MPAMKPDLIDFKNIYLEKVVNLFSRFLFILFKHLLIIETFELFCVKNFSFRKAFHLIKVKKLKFLKIAFKIKCLFSINFIL